MDLRAHEVPFQFNQRLDLPPRAVILPWTKADDSALARVRVPQATSSTQEADRQHVSDDPPQSGSGEQGGSER